MKLVLLGTYDLGKPRVRLLRDAVRHSDIDLTEVHRDVWAGIEDKSQLTGFFAKLKLLGRWLLAYPALILRYLGCPKHQHVIIPYMGIFDVIVFYPFIKLRGGRIYWDVFFSLYDTIVRDRNLLRERGLRARVLYGVEWLASRLADVPFLDTKAHAEYFSELYRLPSERVAHLPVGVEVENFERQGVRQESWDGSRPLEVMFYGQFIPLHGLDILVDAISLWGKSGSFPIHWTIIGEGQESARIDTRIEAINRDDASIPVSRIPWVAYNELAQTIAAADVCCGIFGTSEKAIRVIPNKIYQIFAMGKPVITGDTTAIRELASPSDGLELVAPGDPHALVKGLEKLGERMKSRPEEVFKAASNFPIYDVRMVEEKLIKILSGKR